MSFVWNVILSFGDEEFEDDEEEGAEDDEDDAMPRETCDALENINAWIPHGRLVSLTPPTYAEGAGYGMSAHLFGGGFRHFDIEGFIDVVQAQAWRDPLNVQLFLKSDASDSFSLCPMFEPRVEDGD